MTIIKTTIIYGTKITRALCAQYGIRKFNATGMSIRSYFKPKDGLPDPKGSLSSCLPSQAIALASKEVEKLASEKGIGKQCGQYRR